jgi:hypothetical protein
MRIQRMTVAGRANRSFSELERGALARAAEQNYGEALVARATIC